MDILFEPGEIGSMHLKNKILMTPLHMGFTMPQEVAFLEARAAGGAASVTAVMGISNNAAPTSMNIIGGETAALLSDMAMRMEKHDTRSIVQLFHAGRNIKKGTLRRPGAVPVAPSAIPSPIYKTMPHALTAKEIQQITEEFANAALVCKKAGIDAVEINCSAGYLLTEFLSPHTNVRTDEYGGSLENRLRFPKEVIQAVRFAVGVDYPVLIRLSGAAMVDGGYTLEDVQVLAQETQDWLDCYSVTGGWHESPFPQINHKVSPGDFAYMAKAVKDVVSKPVVACNRLNTGEAARDVLENGMGDFAGCARAFIVDPAFAEKVRTNAPYKKCVACNTCLRAVLFNKPAVCPLNKDLGHEWEK